MFTFLRSFLFLLCLSFASVINAALPDPMAFSWAIEKADVKQVKQWLDEGLDPEFQGAYIGSGLMAAAWYGNLEIMQLFVARGANPRRANRHGEQPLQLAAWNGHTEAVKWLLAHGAPLNREGNYWGALHYAVFNGHGDLAKFLLQQGAQINARSPNGTTPLMLAAREGRENIAKFLLEAGADRTVKNEWGDTALIMAMRYDHYALGKVIATTPEEFELAAKAPKESYGEPSRSDSAPASIDDVLKKIREADANGRATELLNKELAREVDKFRRTTVSAKDSRRALPVPYQPRSMVITAKRGQPNGERAQIVDKNAVKPANSAPAIQIKPADQRDKQAKIAELMRQIRLKEMQGESTKELQDQVADLANSL